MYLGQKKKMDKQAGAELGQAKLPTAICVYYDWHLLHYTRDWAVHSSGELKLVTY